MVIMGRITVDGEGDIIIKRKRKKEEPPKKPDKSIPTKPPDVPPKSDIVLLRNIVEQMEIRVESIFRPKQQDVETAYALSGDNNTPDTFHKFTSNEVISDASPMVVYTVTENKIKHINQERDEKPSIVVDVHTHPDGPAELSEQDKITHKKVAKIFKEEIPNVTILFGVHAISEEGRFRRSDVTVSKNKVKWTSITRQHEVGFFDENSNPVDVVVWEQ